MPREEQPGELSLGLLETEEGLPVPGEGWGAAKGMQAQHQGHWHGGEEALAVQCCQELSGPAGPAPAPLTWAPSYLSHCSPGLGCSSLCPLPWCPLLL